MKAEQTFVLIKPDGVSKKIVGEILSRFEKADLSIKRLEMLNAKPELVDAHYPNSETWLRKVGDKTLNTYRQYEMDPIEMIGTADNLTIGKMVKQWLIQYLTSAPVVIAVIEGNHAVDKVRKLVGETIPLFASPGTIRGDFSSDSPDLANFEKRAVVNLIHASESSADAKIEIELWFSQ